MKIMNYVLENFFEEFFFENGFWKLVIIFFEVGFVYG